jgi:exonuclease SbcD
MKFIHTADWHLGKLFYGGYLTEEQEWILMNQFLPLVDEEKPDVIFLAGDVYDRSVPPAEAVELFDRMVSEICEKRHIPMVVISGNHDSPERLSFASALLRETGLYMCGDLGTTTAPISFSDEFGEVVIVPLPYADPGMVRHFLSDDTVHDHDGAERALSHYLLASVPAGVRKIALAHEFVAGGTASDSERPLSIGGTEQVGADVFADYNYTALGHLHRPQKAGSDAVRYSGSLLKYSFSEASQPKGVIVGTLDGEGQVETRFVPLKPRHDVRIITGTFDELMKKEDEAPDDFLRADLLDEGPIVDAMARLRTRYPNLMALTTQRLTVDDSGERSFDMHQKIEDIDMIRTFMEEFRERDLTPEEEACVKEVIEEMKKEGQE